MVPQAIKRVVPRFHGVPLRSVLVVPFVVQIFVAVGLTGWLSLRNGQQAVNDVASQLRREITARIDQQLQTDLNTPHRVNTLSVEAIRRFELWNPEDSLEHIFEPLQTRLGQQTQGTQQVLVVLPQIPEHHALLYTRLQHLVDHFRYDILIELSQRALLP